MLTNILAVRRAIQFGPGKCIESVPPGLARKWMSGRQLCDYQAA